MTPHDTRYRTGLKGQFAFLRTFKENALRIFRIFEPFAKGFIDVEKSIFFAGTRCAGMGRAFSQCASQRCVHHERVLRQRDGVSRASALALV
jgi:hypothetical protein